MISTDMSITSQLLAIKEIDLEDAISQYNLVVDCYNNPINQTDGIFLKKMGQSKLYQQMYELLSKSFSRFAILLILVLLPFINIMVFFLIIFSYIKIKKGLRTYNQNRLICDPFQNMIHSDEICQLMNKHFWFFTIQLSAIEGFTFNQETIADLKSRNDNGIIKFMVFDVVFEQYYTNFVEKYTMHKNWVIVSTIIIVIFYAFLTAFLIAKL